MDSTSTERKRKVNFTRGNGKLAKKKKIKNTHSEKLKSSLYSRSKNFCYVNGKRQGNSGRTNRKTALEEKFKKQEKEDLQNMETSKQFHK